VPSGGAAVLHKDQIPQLEKAITLATQDVLRTCAKRTAPGQGEFPKHGPHGPVSPMAQKLSIFSQAYDALSRHANLLVPV